MGSTSKKASLLDRLAHRFGSARPATDAPGSDRVDGLSDRLKKLRGDNITVVAESGKLPPNRDGIKNLSNAARDGRYIDRSNEDEVVSNLRS